MKSKLKFLSRQDVRDALLILGELTPEEVRYCVDPSRGVYRGFAALHDLMDANTLVPFPEGDGLSDDEAAAQMEAHIGRLNAATDMFNFIMLAP